MVVFQLPPFNNLFGVPRLILNFINFQDLIMTMVLNCLILCPIHNSNLGIPLVLDNDNIMIIIQLEQSMFIFEISNYDFKLQIKNDIEVRLILKL